jgi:uncharacterized protein (DUF302 family)
MSYHFTKTLTGDFEQTIQKVTETLAGFGFGVLTTIDVQATMKKKINEDIRPYTILGACNPKLAFRALAAENKIGTMLPCNVVVQQIADGSIEVSAVDPAASMSAIENDTLGALALEVQDLLKQVIAAL